MRIHQAGAGGAGFYLPPSLCRDGYDVIVYDDDTLEGGMGHKRLPQASPPTRKVDLLRGFCLAVMGDQGVLIVPRKFTGEEVAKGDLVIDCTDMSLTQRKPVYQRVIERGARYLRVSYDGRNNTVVVAEGLPLRGRPNGGYADIPDLALSFVAGGMGAIAVKKILQGWTSHIEFQVSLDTYFVNWEETTNGVQETNGEGLPAHEEE
jgi:hypothetical protein